MTNQNSIKKIKIGNHGFILIEGSGQTAYDPEEVLYQFKKEIIPIGIYYPKDGGMSQGWMQYNDTTIAIVKEYLPYCIRSFQVDVMFDINTRLFIEGSQEDLIAYYNQQFCTPDVEEEKGGFQKKLLIQRTNK